MIRTIRRVTVVGGLLAGLTALSAGPAFADAPKFQSVTAAKSGVNLVISFREIGLGNANITYRATATGSAVYSCVNGGGSVPSDAKKTTVSGAVRAGASFTPKNGVVNGSLTLTPPGPGTFSCPNGQTRTLISASYSNVSLTDTTNNVSATLSGTF